MQVVADRITAAREAGKGSAVIAGQQLVDEDAYALSRFARTVLGTNDVDARRVLGGEDEDAVLAALPKTITAANQDIDTAKLIVTIGVDLHEESPIVFLRVRKAGRKGVPVREISARRSAGNVQGARIPVRVGSFDTVDSAVGTPGAEYAISIHNALADDRNPNVIACGHDDFSSCPTSLLYGWYSSSHLFGTSLRRPLCRDQLVEHRLCRRRQRSKRLSTSLLSAGPRHQQ